MEAFKIPLTALPPEGLRVSEAMSEAFVDTLLAQDPLFQPIEPGQLSVHLVRCDDNVVVSGQASLSLRSCCGRCGADVAVSLSTPLDITLVPESNAPSADAEGALSEDDVGLGVYRDDQVDLAQVVHDEVLLDLPMQVLCRQDCQGLCAVCGANANDMACGCEQKNPLNPFAQLAADRAASPEA